jgi:ATP-dependent Clp protease ATP-binding subunit ClpC
MTEFTPAGMLAWKIAATEAGAGGHPLIQPVHLVIGVLSLEKVRPAFAEAAGVGEMDLDSVRVERATLAEMLAGLHAQAAVLRRAMREAAGRGPGAKPGPVSRDAGAREAFARAEALASPGPATTLHLLAALATSPDTTVAAGFAACGLDATRVAARAGAFAGVTLRAEATAVASPPAPARPAPAPVPSPVAVAAAAAEPPAPAPPAGTPTLDRFGRDLTALARKGELPLVVGRRRELLAILQTLARSNKPNPLLVGEPGVGKTAIVEALATRAAEGKDEAVLGGRRIVELNLGALLGGTQYRGELEERVSLILAEARAHPELLLFADEVHTLVGAGRVGNGGADLASLVKPALSRGELCLIGATTPQEYRRHIEDDPALARRFDRIDVQESDDLETLDILRGLRQRFEEHHLVRIEDAALTAAVELAVRFDTEHRLPDKAIDLVDRACARARVPELSLNARADTPLPPATVDAALVARVLADARGLPIELVEAGSRSDAGARAESLAAFLRERLVGQEPAIDSVARRIRLAHSAVVRRPGPLAVFLLLGPTGVGKTELARLLAEHLFGDRDSLVRFDMSEYMEEHSVSRLLGAPPGYVGHEQEGLLVRELRARPYAVVLLDEVEKAHPRVFDVFLQVFDEGRVTDVHGRTANARHAIFVLTSNLGQAALRERPGFGWDQQSAALLLEAQALAEARRFFRPELLNRIDEILVFRPLGPADAGRILRRLLDTLAATVREAHGVQLSFDTEAEAFVARNGSSAEYGVRELRRTVERLVEAPLATLVTSGKLKRHPAWRLTYDEGGVYWLPGEG